MGGFLTQSNIELDASNRSKATGTWSFSPFAWARAVCKALLQLLLLLDKAVDAHLHAWQLYRCLLVYIALGNPTRQLRIEPNWPAVLLVVPSMAA